MTEPYQTAPEASQDWYFTFGCGQPNANCYVVFHGTHAGARERMVNSFGTRWSMQYSASEFGDQAKRYNLRRLS